MKENGIDKVAGKDAEKETKAIFESDDDMPTRTSAFDRLPPELDEDEEEDESISASTTDDEKDQ
jgi:hypothetical protein